VRYSGPGGTLGHGADKGRCTAFPGGAFNPLSTTARLSRLRGQRCGTVGVTVEATRGGNMPGPQWVTYDEAAARLGISGNAIRRRAARGRWARMAGNDGLTRIQMPDEVPPPRRGNVGPTAATIDTAALVVSLEAHIATLKAEVGRLTGELAEERTGRQADRDSQAEQLAAARAAAEKATAELAALAQRLADLAARPWWRRLIG
jgi:hypothetical protein